MIDLFADYFSRKKRQFASQCAYGKPEFIDAFSKDWAPLGRVYVCPPIPLIPDVVRKLEAERRARGIMLVPAWKTGYFWPYNGSKQGINPRFRDWKYIKADVKAREWGIPFMAGTEKEFVAIRF